MTACELPKYRQIVAHYEACLAQHGDTHQGVDWPNADDASKRYGVMLDVVRNSPGSHVSLLDFGCGTGHLLSHLRENGREDISYSGLDMSPRFIEVARRKFPDVPFYCLDVLMDDTPLPTFDYIVMNGVFTEKLTLSYDQMFAYFCAVLQKCFGHTRTGMAFNVMAKQVDWEREDLFHVPLDDLAWFLVRHVSRHFVFRRDYGLYEYTTYVYTSPTF